LREKPKVSGQGEDGDKTVSFRVFLSDDERTEFKVECAKDKTTMSQQARELILNWLAEKQQPTQKQTKRRGKVGDEE
jgi:hypothetical protein